MIDMKKVIKGLEKCKRHECDDCTEKGASQAPWDCPAYDDFVDSALALLKDQEPLEPKRVEIEQAGPLYHRCYCQKCGHHVGNMINNKVADVHENFCSKCGQAVKWDE